MKLFIRHAGRFLLSSNHGGQSDRSAIGAANGIRDIRVSAVVATDRAGVKTLREDGGY